VTFDVEGVAYTAGVNGSVCVWDQAGQLEKVLKAHTAECTALIHEDGKLITAGKDNKIIVFTAAGGEYKQQKVIDLEESYTKAIDYFNGNILVGLRNGTIYEINESTGEKRHLMSSHHEGEAWGLDIVPETNSIFTVGDDNKILEFDYETRKYVRRGTIAPNASTN
jgi:WD40 repeat protein